MAAHVDSPQRVIEKYAEQARKRRHERETEKLRSRNPLPHGLTLHHAASSILEWCAIVSGVHAPHGARSPPTSPLYEQHTQGFASDSTGSATGSIGSDDDRPQSRRKWQYPSEGRPFTASLPVVLSDAGRRSLSPEFARMQRHSIAQRSHARASRSNSDSHRMSSRGQSVGSTTSPPKTVGFIDPLQDIVGNGRVSQPRSGSRSNSPLRWAHPEKQDLAPDHWWNTYKTMQNDSDGDMEAESTGSSSSYGPVEDPITDPRFAGMSFAQEVTGYTQQETSHPTAHISPARSYVYDDHRPASVTPPRQEVEQPPQDPPRPSIPQLQHHKPKRVRSNDYDILPVNALQPADTVQPQPMRQPPAQSQPPRSISPAEGGAPPTLAEALLSEGDCFDKSYVHGAAPKVVYRQDEGIVHSAPSVASVGEVNGGATAQPQPQPQPSTSAKMTPAASPSPTQEESNEFVRLTNSNLIRTLRTDKKTTDVEVLHELIKTGNLGAVEQQLQYVGEGSYYSEPFLKNKKVDDATPLITAIQANHLHIVKFLLRKSGEEVYCADIEGMTAFHVACKVPDYVVIAPLVAAATDRSKRKTLLNKREYKNGQTALHFLLRSGRYGQGVQECVAMLIQAGSDVTIEDNRGVSCAELMLRDDMKDILLETCQKFGENSVLATLEKLQERKKDPNLEYIVNKSGRKKSKLRTFLSTPSSTNEMLKFVFLTPFDQFDTQNFHKRIILTYRELISKKNVSIISLQHGDPDEINRMMRRLPEKDRFTSDGVVVRVLLSNLPENSETKNNIIAEIVASETNPTTQVYVEREYEDYSKHSPIATPALTPPEPEPLQTPRPPAHTPPTQDLPTQDDPPRIQIIQATGDKKIRTPTLGDEVSSDAVAHAAVLRYDSNGDSRLCLEEWNEMLKDLGSIPVSESTFEGMCAQHGVDVVRGLNADALVKMFTTHTEESFREVLCLPSVGTEVAATNLQNRKALNNKTGIVSGYKKFNICFVDFFANAKAPHAVSIKKLTWEGKRDWLQPPSNTPYFETLFLNTRVFRDEFINQCYETTGGWVQFKGNHEFHNYKVHSVCEKPISSTREMMHTADEMDSFISNVDALKIVLTPPPLTHYGQVKIVGLKESRYLNGKTGTIASVRDRGQVVLVKVPGVSMATPISHFNIVPIDAEKPSSRPKEPDATPDWVKPGLQVRIEGLKIHSHLNNQIGTIVCLRPSDKVAIVKLPGVPV